MTFFDSNVIFDVMANDPIWTDWSLRVIAEASRPRLIAPIVFAELAGRVPTIAELEHDLMLIDLRVEEPTRAALFLAGKAHVAYRRRGGSRERVLADFLIGAQAVDQGAVLVTRDAKRYRTAFPSLRLTTP